MYETNIRELLTVRQAAAEIGITPSSLYAAIKNGRIDTTLVLGRTGIWLEEVRRYKTTAGQRRKMEAPAAQTIGERLMQYAGIGASGDPLLAENAKEVYYADLEQRHREDHV